MEWRIQQLEPDVYLVGSKKSSVHLYLVKGSEAALLIDTGCGGKHLHAFITHQIQTPFYVVNTHGHYDHIGCNGEFDQIFIHKDDVMTLHAHSDPHQLYKLIVDINPKCKVWMDRLHRPRMFHPSVCKQVLTIADGYIFHLGNLDIEVLHTPGHSQGSICLYEAKRHILFAGDSICEKMVLLGMDYSASVSCYREALKKLNDRLPYDVRIYSNHHTPLLTKAYLKDYIQCANQIIQHPEDAQMKKMAGVTIQFQSYGKARLTYDVNKI